MTKKDLYAAGRALRDEQERHAKGSPAWRALEKRIRSVSDRLEKMLAKELREERSKYLKGLGLASRKRPKQRN